MKKATVYALRDKRKREVFYVGVTAYSADNRLADHLNSVKNGTHLNKHFANKVRKIGAENVECIVLEQPPMAKRWDREREWIERLSKKHKLTNRIHNGIMYDALSPEDTAENEKRLRELVSGPKPKSSNKGMQEAIDSAWRYGEAVLRLGRIIKNGKA